MCANWQQGIQHARRTRLPRVHERERLKCSLCASAVCPPCLLHIKRNVASAYEMYGWNVSVFMRWNVAQARSCCCCMCPLYGSPLPCISALMAGRDPRATNELQVMALFCPGYSLLIRSPPHALQIVRSCRSLYLSDPQSIFQRLGRSQANWRNCYWFSVFVCLWSFPGHLSRIFTPYCGWEVLLLVQC